MQQLSCEIKICTKVSCLGPRRFLVKPLGGRKDYRSSLKWEVGAFWAKSNIVPTERRIWNKNATQTTSTLAWIIMVYWKCFEIVEPQVWRWKIKWTGRRKIPEVISEDFCYFCSIWWSQLLVKVQATETFFFFVSWHVQLSAFPLEPHCFRTFHNNPLPVHESLYNKLFLPDQVHEGTSSRRGSPFFRLPAHLGKNNGKWLPSI